MKPARDPTDPRTCLRFLITHMYGPDQILQIQGLVCVFWLLICMDLTRFYRFKDWFAFSDCSYAWTRPDPTDSRTSMRFLIAHMHGPGQILQIQWLVCVFWLLICMNPTRFYRFKDWFAFSDCSYVWTRPDPTDSRTGLRFLIAPTYGSGQIIRIQGLLCVFWMPTYLDPARSKDWFAFLFLIAYMYKPSQILFMPSFLIYMQKLHREASDSFVDVRNYSKCFVITRSYLIGSFKPNR